MNSYATLHKQAQKSKDAKDFAQAVRDYELLLKSYPKQCTKWDLWAFAFSLNKIKKHHRALEIARLGYQKDASFKNIRQVYAWAIYYTAIKTPSKDPAIFAQAVKAVQGLTSITDSFGPYILTVFKAAEYWNQQKEWGKTIDLLKVLEPQNLSTESYSFIDHQGERQEMASPQEKYYAYLTKAQIGHREWRRCIDTAQAGLNAIQKFHYANNIWLRWRMSEAHYHLQEYDKALELLTYIERKKKDWFVIAAIGTNKLALQQDNAAKKYFAKACLAQGDLSKKVKVLRKLIKLFRKEQKTAFVKVHLLLLKAIYEEETWTIPTDLDTLLASYDLSKDIKKNQIWAQAKKIWSEITYADTPVYEGRIQSILPNGQAGFVQSGKQSYFASIRDFRASAKLFQKGQAVRFMLKDGYDKKKQRKTKNAFNIHPLKK